MVFGRRDVPVEIAFDQEKLDALMAQIREATVAMNSAAENLKKERQKLNETIKALNKALNREATQRRLPRITNLPR